MNNQQRVDYSVQTDIDHAVNFKKLIPHIFCSEVCEDRFLNKYSQHFSLSIHEKTYIMNYNTEKIFSPVSFPINAFDHKKKICKQCDNSFPYYHKYYYILEIIERKKLDGKLAYEQLNMEDQIPKPNTHEIIVSDINKDNTVGHYYVYKIGLNQEFINFCSNDCAFDYCKIKESVCITISNIEKGSTLSITPDLIDINKALRNIYKYKPIEFHSNINLPKTTFNEQI